MIHQINMTFNPEEDRIVFKLNTVGKEEFRFYFTRRYVKLLWPILLRMAESEYKIRNPETGHLARAVMPFERENALTAANFKTHYSSDIKSYPLGEDIILLSGIRVRNENILCLLPSRGKGIEIKMDSRMLHSFMELLRQTARAAQWDLDQLLGTAQKAGKKAVAEHTIH